jgi:hypothetical protein
MSEIADDADPGTDDELLRRSTAHAVFDDFLPLATAQALRGGIDRHFAEPHRHRQETHQIWNYWFVPDAYTYLRTAAERILPFDAMRDFTLALQNFAATRLGLTHVTRPLLSLYVNGCFQAFHNDSTNGRFAFVYSLTKPQRSFTGGETLVWHEGDYFAEQFLKPLAATGLYQSIAPDFNRLVLFDDRMPHAVAPIFGRMDPAEGRLVMHGHIAEGPAHVAGTLTAAEAQAGVTAGIAALKADLGPLFRQFHGPLSLDLVVDAEGRVDGYGVLLNRLRPIGAQSVTVEQAVGAVLDRLDVMRFPASAGETEIKFPILFGG